MARPRAGLLLSLQRSSRAEILYRRLFKPAIDRLVGVSALIALAPVIAVTAVLVRRRLGSPVIFRQTRIGKNDREFEFLKFRSMTDERDASGTLLPDDRRLTPFGQFLRSSSLDELPQLWNVAKGAMSLIGPRPLLPQYLPRYTPFQRRRHEVKPGITGLAQVRGRNALSWEHKFKLDVEYVDACSARLDIQIFTETVLSVVRRDGISRAGHATAPEFLGTNTPK
jgi:lipopolysaccharide/colanic/teichoic acid biosynthesis glycosyltransferase